MKLPLQLLHCNCRAAALGSIRPAPPNQRAGSPLPKSQNGFRLVRGSEVCPFTTALTFRTKGRNFSKPFRITQAKSERSSPRQVGSGDTSPACSKRKKSRTELRQKTNGSRNRPLKTLKNGLFRGFFDLFDKICHYRPPRPLNVLSGFFDKIFLSFSIF